MYLTVEGFSPIIRANALTEGLATGFRYRFPCLMHASTSAFRFYECTIPAFVACEKKRYTVARRRFLLCAWHIVCQERPTAFVFGPRRPGGDAPSGVQENGLYPSSCFGLPKACPSFRFLRFSPKSAQHHCGRFTV